MRGREIGREEGTRNYKKNEDENTGKEERKIGEGRMGRDERTGKGQRVERERREGKERGEKMIKQEKRGEEGD